MTNITIIGNTTAPAELRFTPQGIAAASFTVAVNERKKVRDEWVDVLPRDRLARLRRECGGCAGG